MYDHEKIARSQNPLKSFNITKLGQQSPKCSKKVVSKTVISRHGN